MIKKLSSLSIIGRFFALIGKERPQLLFWIFLSSGLNALNILTLVYFPKYLIDLLMESGDLSDIVRLCFFFLPIKITIYYLESLVSTIIGKENKLLDMLVSKRLSDKVNRMKYAFLEMPEILKLKEAARMPIQIGVVFEASNAIQSFISSIFIIGGISVILIRFSPLLFLFTTVFVFLSLFVEFFLSKAIVKFQAERVEINQQYNYFFNELVSGKRQKEFRVYGNNDLIIATIKKFNLMIYDKIKKLHQIESSATSLSAFFTFFSKFVTYSYIGMRTLGIWGGGILLGDFSLMVGASENYSKTLSDLGYHLVYLISIIPNLNPLFEFLNLEEQTDAPDALDVEEFQTLQFEHVSFSYPKTERKILDDLNFMIKKGETVALVGVNNSGKSTIVKLICRLFEPTEGRILWNGTDIRTLRYSSYLKEISTVFQDFKLFPVSIGENILADLKEEEGGFLKEEEERMREIIEELDLLRVIEALPNGLSTMLNKNLNEDATDFSGGEKQKIAIARAVYGTSSFAILDEPTAALDPLAEAEVYGHFSNLVKNKTAIFISHRMSASRFADRILILENGKITGDGSHKELIIKHSLYRSLYEAQAQYYQ